MMPSATAGKTFPRLKANVDVFRHIYQNEIWYVFHDRAMDRIVRVSALGGEFLAMLDGRRPAAAVLDDFIADHDGSPDAARQMQSFLKQMDGLGLLTGTGSSRIGVSESLAKQERSRSWKGFLKSPVSFRIPLIDPEPVLRLLQPLTPWLFGALGMSVWLAVVTLGAILAALHWTELTEDFGDRVFSLENLAVAGIAYPAIKVIHESMHALALKHYGCEVRRMGLLFIAGIPVPYVDASMSMTLVDKYARILVAGAGIIAELFLFGLAAVIWVASEPGLVHTFCYNVLILTGLSTLLFNGNPLQRYDGYYMMCDLIEIPDLGSRAARFVGVLCKRWILGDSKAVLPRASTYERGWFVGYGVASSIYRTTLIVTIALYIADAFPFVGAALAIWTLAGAAAGPLMAVYRAVREPSGTGKLRLVARLGLLITILGVGLFAIPAPSAVVSQGYVELPDENLIKSQANGKLGELRVASGDTVAAGTVIAVLENPNVDSRLVHAKATVREMEATYLQASATSRVQAGIARERLDQSRQELAAVQFEKDGLAVRSSLAGTVVITAPEDLPGRWIARGETLGFIRPQDAPVVRTVIPQWQIDRVRRFARSVSVRMSYDPESQIAGKIARIVPAASDVLPNQVLSLDGGGTYAVTTRDAEGAHTAEILFRVDIQLAKRLPIDYFSGRADVRFDLGLEPIGWQLLRTARLVFLRHFHA
jgi:putative peptide zinc metalloprotease protein